MMMEGKSGRRLWAIIASLILPPLGVYLVRDIGPLFWVTLVLTLLAFVPGVIFALVAVLAPSLLPVSLSARHQPG
jgi:uncharacterized membrane protein YqaE (UPF0057 family)